MTEGAFDPEAIRSTLAATLDEREATCEHCRRFVRRGSRQRVRSITPGGRRTGRCASGPDPACMTTGPGAGALVGPSQSSASEGLGGAIISVFASRGRKEASPPTGYLAVRLGALEACYQHSSNTSGRCGGSTPVWERASFLLAADTPAVF